VLWASNNVEKQYVRYSRDVHRSNELEEFHAAKREATHDVFGDKNSVLKRTTMVRPPTALGRLPGFRTTAIGVDAVEDYPPQSWRLTQFEVALDSNDERTPALTGLYIASRRLIRHVPFASDTLEVTCSSAGFRRQPGYEHLPEQIVLNIDSRGDAIILDEQNKLFSFQGQNEFLVQQTAHNELDHELSASDHPAQSLSIPVGRLPHFPGERLDEYEELKLKLAFQIGQYLPLEGVELGRVRCHTSD
jgi:hypothetical protein